MGGGHIAVAQIFKADLSADEGAAAVVAEHVEASAGAHAYNSIFSLSRSRKSRNSCVKIGHKSIHLFLKAEHGRNDSCIFSAYISHQNNIHARKIFYQNNEIQIVDSIKSNANANYTIQFLLSDKYTPIATVDKDSINICQNNKIKAIIKFLNIDTIHYSKGYYYPTYANKKETFAIKGQGTLKNGLIDIITKISFL